MWELFICRKQGISLDNLYNGSVEYYYKIAYLVTEEIEAKEREREKKE